MVALSSLLTVLRDPTLAAQAWSEKPLWLFDTDGATLQFANPAGAALLGFENCTSSIRAAVDPRIAAHISRIAASLPYAGHPRLALLRGLGTGLGKPLTCGCSKIRTAAGPAILVAAAEPFGPALTLSERTRRLVDGADSAIAAFASDGTLVFAAPQALQRLRGARSLSAVDAGTETLRIGEGASALTLAVLPVPGEAHAQEPVPSEATDSAAAHEKPDATPVDLTPIADAMAVMTRAQPEQREVSNAAEPNASDSSSTDSLPLQSAADISVPHDTDAPALPHVIAGLATRRHPLRFVWETDEANRFTVFGDEFLALAGPQTVDQLGHSWGDIAAALALDPDRQVAHAIASRDTWSGIGVNWPAGEGSRVRVELSGIPAFDYEREFLGYRGFGVCRDAAQTAEFCEPTVPPLAADPQPPPEQNATDVVQENAVEPAADISVDAPSPETTPAEEEREAATPDAVPEHVETVQPSENVVPFRATTPDQRNAALSPVERTAFRELASRLTARLKGADELARGQIEGLPHDEVASSPAGIAQMPAAALMQAQAAPDLDAVPDVADMERPIFDRLPVGILVYRLERCVYANPAFLRSVGYASLGDFAQAGGLESLFIEPPGHVAADAAGAQALRIATPAQPSPIDAQLFSAPFEGESATVLMLVPNQPAPAHAASVPADTQAAELKSVLDIAADGVVMVTGDGRILEANASAEALFGYGPGELSGRSFSDLFAPESERIAMVRLERIAGMNDAARFDEGREIIGRRRQGELLSLHIVLGRADREGRKFCAVIRDMSEQKKTEQELVLARQQAEKASSAKSDFLAKISHDMRTPLNAIIGFSEVMMDERLGSLGNERHRSYLNDIHASGVQLVSLLNDLVDLSKIEAGRLELTLERVNLNDLMQQAVAVMQAQASRGRIIVRTALSINIPSVIADARSVRQIVLNLLSNSIKFTGPGGQVIVSTAATDGGDVMLRVRDTGAGMSERDIEMALEPFRQLATSSRMDASGTGLGLPLTKALAEANRARFSIKSAVNAGTLVEIVFPASRTLAE